MGNPAAAIHPLTPGSPAYAAAKLAAVGGLFALRIALSRRKRSTPESDHADEAPTPSAELRRSPHPVSRRKAKRRRRR
ncbi:MAG TPA: hypothetical protein VFB44_06350 [Thermoleophilaceae bacterium]|nr:hypothetical protein [Thermoleophilaceae bacterium]